MTRAVELPDGGHLNAVVEGPESAPWVVFSNSVLTDLSIWEPQAAALRDRFRVLRYDQRGHGKSSVRPGPMSFDDYGADLAALMRAVGASDACFVGLSMGVPTGLAAHNAMSGLFRRFVFTDGVSRSGAGREAFWTERRAFARTQGMQALAEQTAARWLPGEAQDSASLAALIAMIAATPVEGFAAATHALGAYDQSAALASVIGATLCIAGTLDGAMPDTMKAQFAGLPDVRFAGVEGAGHVPNHQKPAAYTALLVDFLEATA